MCSSACPGEVLALYLIHRDRVNVSNRNVSKTHCIGVDSSDSQGLWLVGITFFVGQLNPSYVWEGSYQREQVSSYLIKPYARSQGHCLLDDFCPAQTFITIWYRLVLQ